VYKFNEITVCNRSVTAFAKKNEINHGFGSALALIRKQYALQGAESTSVCVRKFCSQSADPKILRIWVRKRTGAQSAHLFPLGQIRPYIAVR